MLIKRTYELVVYMNKKLKQIQYSNAYTKILILFQKEKQYFTNYDLLDEDLQ